MYFFFHYYNMLNINTLDSLHTQFQSRSRELYIISTYDFHFMFCLILYYELFNTTTHSLIILIFIYTLIQYNCHIYITITKLCHLLPASIFILNPHFCCSIATSVHYYSHCFFGNHYSLLHSKCLHTLVHCNLLS